MSANGNGKVSTLRQKMTEDPAAFLPWNYPRGEGGRRGASASRLSENGGIDAPPVIGEIGAIRQTVV